jgi:transposase
MLQFEQRANIKLMCRLGKSASETLSVLQQVYGDTALKKSAVYDWFSRFKDGQETLEDDQRSGRPSTSRTEEMIVKVRQLTQGLINDKQAFKNALERFLLDNIFYSINDYLNYSADNFKP